MLHVTVGLALLVGPFVAMLGLVEVGRRVGLKTKAGGFAAIEAAVFGLLGLLIAFTFGTAGVRFEARRNLIVEETNKIGTAYLRLDLLPESAQPKLRDAFRRYVDTRLAFYRNLAERDASNAELAHMAGLQREIWSGAVAACRESGSSPVSGMLLLPALNAMIDITTTRTVALRIHQPTMVLVMLALLMLACALLAGFDLSTGEGRRWLHVVCFAAVLTLAFYVILDLEYPRVGLIRIDWMDQILQDLRNGMV